MKIAIGIIHGMGSQALGFSETFQRKLLNYYEKLSSHSNRSDLLFKEIYWADVLLNQQKRLFERINYHHDLRFTETRHFLIDYLGDAIAYQPLSENHDP